MVTTVWVSWDPRHNAHCPQRHPQGGGTEVVNVWGSGRGGVHPSHHYWGATEICWLVGGGGGVSLPTLLAFLLCFNNNLQFCSRLLRSLLSGIPETGKFDENTVRMMMTPRCQNPDILDVNRSQLNKFFLGQTDSDLQSRIKRASTSSGKATPKWTKTDLTFSFENTTPQNPRTKDILTAAFEAWGECSTPTFTEVELSQDPDIEIKFARALHEPPNKCAFDGPAGGKLIN